MNGRTVVFTADFKVRGVLWRRIGLNSSIKMVKRTGNRLHDWTVRFGCITAFYCSFTALLAYRVGRWCARGSQMLSSLQSFMLKCLSVFGSSACQSQTLDMRPDADFLLFPLFCCQQESWNFANVPVGGFVIIIVVILFSSYLKQNSGRQTNTNKKQKQSFHQG